MKRKIIENLLKIFSLAFFLFSLAGCFKDVGLIPDPSTSSHQMAGQNDNPSKMSRTQDETNVPGGLDEKSDSNEVPGGSDETNDPNNSNKATYQFSITQPDQEQKEVDILMVIDNSISMQEDINRLIEGFGNISSGLQVADWQMAFINTDEGTENGYQGRFYNLRNEAGEISVDGNKVKVLSPQLEVEDSLQEIFSNTINHINTDIRFHKERPLNNIINAINLSDTSNQGFFRQDSTLVAIILTDEDEEDENGNKGNTQKPSEVFFAIENKFGASKNFITYGILLENEQCKAKANQQRLRPAHVVGEVVMQLVEDTGGITGCIADEDYSSIVSEMTTHIASQITLNEIYLPYQNVIEDTIEITFTPSVEDVEDYWEFDAENNQITFLKGPPIGGTEIDISFSYYPEVSGASLTK